MKIGANARGDNDIDLFRRPAGLADGLALKEPAPHDPHVVVSPNKLVPPSPGIPPGVRLGRALYNVRRRTQARSASTLATRVPVLRRRLRVFGPPPDASVVPVRRLSQHSFSESCFAGCGGGGDGGADDRPTAGRRAGAGARPGGRRRAGGDRSRLPRLRDKNTTRVGGADAIADAAGVAQAVFPSRGDDTRPAAVALVDATDWRVAVSAAQLMSATAACARPVLRGRRAAAGHRAGARPARPHRRGEGRRRAGHPRRRGGRRRGLQDHRRRGRRLRRARPGDRPAPDRGGRQAVAGGRRRLGRAARLLDAGRRRGPRSPATRCCGSRATRSRPPRARRSRRTSGRGSTCSGRSRRCRRRCSSSSTSSATARRIAGPDPVANAIAFARFSDGSFGWNVVDPGHGLVFATTQRPLDAAAARAAVGVRHLRAAAARDRGERAARAAAGLPARHPARLRRRPRPRRLQPRLDDRRRGRDLRRRPGADRRAAGDPGRGQRRRRRRLPRHGRSRAARAPAPRAPRHGGRRAPAHGRLHPALRPPAPQPDPQADRAAAAGGPGARARRAGDRAARRGWPSRASSAATHEQPGQRRLPSLGEDEPTRYVEGPTRG